MSTSKFAREGTPSALKFLLAAKLSGTPAQEKPEHRSFGRPFDAPAGPQPNAEKKGIAQNPPEGILPNLTFPRAFRPPKA
jgi:hypothetical protein